MDLSRLAHDPNTCRWGRRPMAIAGAPAPTAEGPWLCCHPEEVPGRTIRPSDCTDCPRWEPGMVPPCPAIGWA